MLRKHLIAVTLIFMLTGIGHGPAFAASPFKVSSTTPADGAVDALINGDVTIVWNRDVECATVNTTNITISEGGWVLVSCGANQAVFTTIPQEPGTTYTVNVSTAVADTGGTAMKNPYSMSYTTVTVDTVPPSVASTSPADGAVDVPRDGSVTINWDETVNCATVSTASVTSNSPGWALSSCAGSQAVFATAGQAYSTLYSVTVGTSVADPAGNAMAAPYAFSFTTEVEVLIDADTLDGLDSTDFSLDTHNHDATYQRHYANVIVVSTDGNGDFTSPVDAMNFISDASATNPYLVKIMPGEYYTGGSRVLMKPFVDIEGSGENVTRIKGSVSGYPVTEIGVVEGASNAELRFLTVENVAPGFTPSAICNNNADVSIRNVTAIATGSGTADYGIRNISSSPIITDVTLYAESTNHSYGIGNYLSSPVLKNVTAILTSANSYWNVGIYNQSSDTVVTNLTTVTTGAVHNYGVINGSNGTIRIDNSSIESEEHILSNGAGSTAYIANTRLATGFYNNQGTIKCVNVYDANYDPAVCP